MGRDALVARLGGEEAILRLAPGVDLRTLKISAREGFILTRVQQGSKVRDLLRVCGLPETEALQILLALRRRGILTVIRPPRPPRSDSSRRPRKNGGSTERIRAPLWTQEGRSTTGKRTLSRPLHPDPARSGSPAPSSRGGTNKPGARARLQRERQPSRGSGDTTRTRSLTSGVLRGEAVSGSVAARRTSTLPAAPPAQRSGRASTGSRRHDAPRNPGAESGANIRTTTSPLGRDRGAADRDKADNLRIPSDPFGCRPRFSPETPPPTTLERMAAEAEAVDPAAMSEDVGLEPELKRLVLYLHGRLSELTYYQLLAIPRDAAPKAVRKAFLKRTKLFHPDRYFRKSLGSFEPRFHALYKAVSQAYDVLSDEQKRRIYDFTLRQTEQIVGDSVQISSKLHAEELYRAGKQLCASGDFEGAEKALAQAAELETKEERYRVLLRRVRDLARRILANEAYRRALPALKQRRFKEAVGPLRETVARLPEPEIMVLLARALAASGGDLREAVGFARRAFELRPELLGAAVAISEFEEQLGNRVGARAVLRPLVDQAQEHPGLRARLMELGLLR